MDVTIVVKDFEVCKIHKIEGGWVTIELPEGIAPRFLMLREGDTYSLDVTLSSNKMSAVAKDPVSFKELIDEVATRLRK